MPRNIKPHGDKKNEWILTIEAGKNSGTGNRQRLRRIFNGGIKAAETEYDRLKAEAESGSFTDAAKQTVGEYFSKWITEYGALRLAPTTSRRYKQVITGRVIPKIGAVPLVKLTPMDLQKFYREIIEEGQLVNPKKVKKADKEKNFTPTFKPISHGTVMYHHRVIHKALDTALKQQLIIVNPADAVEVPKPPTELADGDDCDTADRVKVLTAEQVEVLLAVARSAPSNKVVPGKKATKTRVKNNDYFPLLHTAIKTGLRRGELLGLKWTDINFADKTMSVARSLSYTPDKGIFFKLPKTKGSRRKIDLSDEVIKILRAHKKDQAEARLFWGQEYGGDNLIFCQDDGRPMHPDTISKWFPEYLEQIGLPKLNFHCLRHTHVSLMLQAGVNIFKISRRVGHSSIRITLDIYGHLMPGDGADDVERFEKLFKSAD